MLSKLRQVSSIRTASLRWMSAGVLTRQDVVEAIKKYNTSGTVPQFFPVNRDREMKALLETTFENWVAGATKDTITVPILPQSQGFGTTFFLEHFHLFLAQTPDPNVSACGSGDDNGCDGDSADGAALRPAVSALSATAKHFEKLYSKDYVNSLRRLQYVRPIVVPMCDLNPSSKHLPQAILLVAAGKLLGRTPMPLLADELATIGVKELSDLCKLLVNTNGGAVIVLDDFVPLADNPNFGKMLTVEDKGETCSTSEVFIQLYYTMIKLLHKRGVMMTLTGRCPASAHGPRMPGQLWARRQDILPIVLDALPLEEVANILGKLRELLNLHTDQDVLEAARALHFYSGGLLGAVKHAIDGLIADQQLKQRGNDQSVADVLTHDVMMRLYHSCIKDKRELMPRWSRVVPTWNAAKTMHELLVALQYFGEPLENKYVDVGAADGFEIRLVELLYVMGMPFLTVSTAYPKKVSVYPSPWVLEAMGEDAAFDSTDKQAFDELKHEVLLKANEGMGML